MTHEMKLFRKMLDAEHIKWHDASDYTKPCPMCRTHFIHRGYDWSVIHGYGSYGGYSILTSDKGLLEMMSDAVNGGDPVGYLTAEEAMQYVRGEGIEEAPTIEQPIWIPCSERLPSEEGQYLVWAVIGIVPDHVDDPSTYQGITIASYYGDAHPIKWLGNVEKVLAWMPLPEPWKGADDE